MSDPNSDSDLAVPNVALAHMLNTMMDNKNKTTQTSNGCSSAVQDDEQQAEVTQQGSEDPVQLAGQQDDES